MTGPVAGDEAGRQPIYSIGAVSGMLGVETATLRAWEERYRVVVPARSDGGQRIYSRDEVEQLRVVVDAIGAGSTPADAHRLLSQRMRDVRGAGRADPVAVTPVILLAERDRYAAKLFEHFLRTEGYDVCVAFDPAGAERMLAERRPRVSVVDLMMAGGDGLELCARLTRGGSGPVLALSPVDLAEEALAAGASAFLAKPVVARQFVSTVRDLMASSDVTPRAPATIS